jgi:very-short-patch-repair endonuclease
MKGRGTNTGSEGVGSKPAMKGERDRGWRVIHHMGEKPAKGDLVIARIASRQHGVVSLAQLETARIRRQGIHRRIEAGRLHRLHRGVYAVGHTRLTFEARCMAAVLALGDTAAVSHRSAAALWGFLPPTDGPIHVTVPSDNGRDRRPGVAVHRSHSLIAAATTRRNGIAVTKPARTLRDLHRVVAQPVYRRAVRVALDRALISSSDLKADDELSRSELERIFLSLCRRHRLPPPEVNVRVDRHEADFLWRGQRVIVETDSWRHHGHRAAFESDRARDTFLQSLGFRVLRFTWRQVLETPETVVRSLRPFVGQLSLTPNL